MRCRLWLTAVLLLACAGASSAQDFFFKDNDVVVVMGDSITEQRLYSNYLEMWTLTRFPAWKLTFRNVGIGGDRSTGGNARFKRDVLAYKPTALTVDFGMNDGNYQPFNEPAFNVYMKGLQGIADQAAAAKIRVAWVTPQPTERGPEANGYNYTLGKYAAGVREIAKKNNGLFCDQFYPYDLVMLKARATKPGITIMGGDAVHPGPPGQALMAASILKGMHFPSEVASISLDLKTKNGPRADVKNCTMPDLKLVGDGVQFTRLDKALPYFPEGADSLLKWTPLLDEMNYYGLQIKGLKAGKYEVRLGGTVVAVHTDAELAKGVNLAEAVLKAGPIAEQVKAVWQAVSAKTNYFHDQIFRGVVLADPKQIPDLKEAANAEEREKRRNNLIADRLSVMPEYETKIRAALEMRPMEMAIVPIMQK